MKRAVIAKNLTASLAPLEKISSPCASNESLTVDHSRYGCKYDNIYRINDRYSLINSFFFNLILNVNFIGTILTDCGMNHKQPFYKLIREQKMAPL